MNDASEVSNNIDPRLFAPAFVHTQKENRVSAIVTNELSCDSRVLRVIHDTKKSFVAQKKGEWRTIAFRKQDWKGNDCADVAIALECTLERPHFLVSGGGIERALVCRGDNEGERARAAVAIDILESVA